MNIKGFDIPDGYITGQDRDTDRGQVTHLYKGTFSEPGLPMCKRGWNRDNGTSYSIWRNNIGNGGICKVCLKRALKGLAGIEAAEDNSGKEMDCIKCTLSKENACADCCRDWDNEEDDL